MNTWATVDLTMIQENLLDVGRHLGIFSAMLARRAVPPRVIAAFRNLKCLAEQGDGIDGALLSDPLKFHNVD